MADLSKRRFSLLLTAVLCLACVARAQTGGGSVRMSGGVSETVVLSVPQGAGASGVLVTSSRNADRSLTVTLSGTSRGLTEVRIPVQIRSNAGYRLFAAAKSGGSNLSSLLVVEARPTGSLVTPDAAEAINVAATFDGRRGVGNPALPANLNRPSLSAPSELLSGPRVSTGGTLQSPHNALEVTMSVAVEPQGDGPVWTVELLLTAAPGESLP
jgi:hypothetical protein